MQVERRQFLATLAATLGTLRERAAAAAPAGERNIRWAVSSFLWRDTIWGQPPVPFTDMLDVIKDTGFDGFRLTGWPEFLEQNRLTIPVLERELSKRGVRIATLSFGGQADDPAAQPQIERHAREACRLLKTFGATELVVFSPRRVNKVLVREHLRVACDFYNHLGDVCAEYGIRAGLHNHSQGQLVESQDEVELFLKLTDPKRFGWAPDTIHLYLGGCNIVELFEKYADRLIFMDFVDARYTFAREDVRTPNGRLHKAGSQDATFLLCNYELGNGEIDFPALMRILKRRRYRGWICIDLHYARISPRHSFELCRQYNREKLDPIYA